MIGRGVLAVANSKLLSLTRSPIAIIICAAFVLLVSSLPDLAAASRVEQIRQASSWLVSAASALLVLSSLLVPVSGGAPRTRFHEARVLGSRRANLGHGVAGLVFLVFLSGLLALVVWGWVRINFQDPEMRTGGPIVRSVVYRNAGSFALRPGESWTSGQISLGPQAGTLQVELSPRLRFREATAVASAANSRASPARLELKWRGAGKARTRGIPLSGTQPVVETIELAELGSQAAPLVIDLRLSARDVELAFDRGDVTVLGVRTPLFPVLMRALLVVGCMAAAIAAATQWFSNFVSPLIAIFAALTLVIAVLTIRVIGPALLPGDVWSSILPEDPVSALRRGHETGWREVGRALLISCAAVAVGAAASVHGPERRDQ